MGTLKPVQTLTINFFQAIDFQLLKIKKRYHPNANEATWISNAYLNVCLVLNDDINNQLCTDQQKGFSTSDDDTIIWDKPTKNVIKVDLVFRDTATYGNAYSGNAMIRDLKIFYVSGIVNFF